MTFIEEFKAELAETSNLATYKHYVLKRLRKITAEVLKKHLRKVLTKRHNEKEGGFLSKQEEKEPLFFIISFKPGFFNGASTIGWPWYDSEFEAKIPWPTDENDPIVKEVKRIEECAKELGIVSVRTDSIAKWNGPVQPDCKFSHWQLIFTIQ